VVETVARQDLPRPQEERAPCLQYTLPKALWPDPCLNPAAVLVVLLRLMPWPLLGLHSAAVTMALPKALTVQSDALEAKAVQHKALEAMAGRRKAWEVHGRHRF